MIGFELIAQNLERNFLANKLHHGIIIAGKKGIGKASFIKQFCQKILQSNGDANADFRIVEKVDDKKTIGIEEIRKQSDFLNRIFSNHFLNSNFNLYFDVFNIYPVVILYFSESNHKIKK